MNIRLAEFEGPLDLLLALIRKNQFDIANLPMAEVTKQYLDYLKQAESADLDLTADFAYMAATLIQIKSRSLLPVDPELASRQGPDAEREDLIRQLLMRQDQMRGAAEFLKQRLELAGASWSRSATGWDAASEDVPAPAIAPGTMNLHDIAKLAKRALEQARLHERWDVGPRGVTVEEMVRFIERELAATGSCEMLDRQPLQNRPALFLALLELAKAERIHLRQAEAFGPVLVEAVA